MTEIIEAMARAFYANDGEQSYGIDAMRAALSAAEAAGWVLVPKEPTEKMHDAAHANLESLGYRSIGLVGEAGVYRAMLAASPKP